MFTNQAVAEAVISSTISANRAQVKAWAKGVGSRGKLELVYSGSDVIGRGLERGGAVGSRSNAKIILKMRENGRYYILTAYPTP